MANKFGDVAKNNVSCFQLPMSVPVLIITQNYQNRKLIKKTQ